MSLVTEHALIAPHALNAITQNAKLNTHQRRDVEDINHSIDTKISLLGFYAFRNLQSLTTNPFNRQKHAYASAIWDDSWKEENMNNSMMDRFF